MSTLLSLPTEMICNIISHLDDTSAICFAVTSKTTFEHVQMSFHNKPLPSLPPARATGLRHKHGKELGCVNHWIIAYLARSDISTSEWHAAYYSFQTLVAAEGCEVCNHALFKYRMRKCMGPAWCLCPDRLKFYKRASRWSHRCKMSNGCLAESWRTLVPKTAVKRGQPSPEEEPEQKRQKFTEDSEVKVDANQGKDEVGVNEDQNCSQTESTVPIRRSKRIVAATKGQERRRQPRAPSAG